MEQLKCRHLVLNSWYHLSNFFLQQCHHLAIAKVPFDQKNLLFSSSRMCWHIVHAMYQHIFKLMFIRMVSEDLVEEEEDPVCCKENSLSGG